MQAVSDRQQRRTVGVMLAAWMTLGGIGLVGLGGATPARAAVGSVGWEELWAAQLPAMQTMSFSAYSLVDGMIIAMASDGSVIAVHAENGQMAWTRRLVEEGETLRPPVVYRDENEHSLVFPRVEDLVMLDFRTGSEIRKPTTHLPISGPAACAPGRVFVPQTRGGMAAVRLKDDYTVWRVAFEAMLTIAPVYAPEMRLVVAVDDSGLLGAFRDVAPNDKRTLFRHALKSQPAGWMAVDGAMLYVSTENQLLHAVNLSLQKDANSPRAGEIVWQYRLARFPKGGPVLTRSAVYQATAPAGLHRIAKNHGEFKNWYDPEATQFLAEWPAGVVVLRQGGKVVVINDDPASAQVLGQINPAVTGMANPLNDAIFLTTAKGDLRCMRPTGAKPLTEADFVPPAPPPATAPAVMAASRPASRPGEDEAAATTEEAASKPAEQIPRPALPSDPLRSKRVR